VCNCDNEEGSLTLYCRGKAISAAYTECACSLSCPSYNPHASICTDEWTV